MLILIILMKLTDHLYYIYQDINHDSLQLGISTCLDVCVSKCLQAICVHISE